MDFKYDLRLRDEPETASFSFSPDGHEKIFFEASQPPYSEWVVLYSIAGL